MLYDISVVVRPGTPEWPGDTPYSCSWTWQTGRGANVNVSRFTTSPHVGTHADAPLHVRDDWPGSHELPLDVFSGHAYVCTSRAGRDELELDDLPTLPPDGRLERLLIRTGRSMAGGAFPDSWPALSPPAAAVLLRRGLRLLGVDAPSVDRRDSKTLDVHRALFAGGAFNLENLDLRRVEDGPYELIALPLLLYGLDAAPVRAVLRRRAEG
jgi:arylformamidase